MANSSVRIANRALQMLGAPAIESLTQDEPRAAAMNLAYEPMRMKLLRSYVWGFAKHRASVPADASQTSWGSLNRYLLPNDYVRLVLDDESRVRVDWRIEGRYIITADAAPLEFIYVRDITDVSLFDASFSEALSALLALATCKEITGSTGELQTVKVLYDEEIREAKRLNALESNPVESLEDDWVNARI